MHRTEGQGYVSEGSFRRFIDRDSGAGITGTVDTAEYNNAVQEELCYTIESVLGAAACSQSASADRSAGWHQLYDAIFDSAALTNAAISDLSVSKLTAGTIDIGSANPGYNWHQTGSSLQYDFVNGTAYNRGIFGTTVNLSNGDTADSFDEYCTLTPVGATFSQDDATGTELVKTVYNARGVRYEVGPGSNADFKASSIRSAAIGPIAGTWSEGSGTEWTSGSTYTFAGIPDETRVYGVRVVRYSGSVISGYHNVSHCTITGNSVSLQIDDLTINSPFDPNSSSLVLVIDYDAATLTED